MGDDIYAMTTRNRMFLADVLESLDARQWHAPTLCTGWTVRLVAGHLLQPMSVGFGRFFLVALRHRGDTDATVDDLARQLARQSPEQLVAALRRHAADRVSPPRVGPMGPFAETCIHLRDIARPLGLDANVPLDHWTTLLTYLLGRDAARSLVVPARLAGLALLATDTSWCAGTGIPLEGPSEALAMAATGRPEALADLAGPGQAILASRLGQLA